MNESISSNSSISSSLLDDLSTALADVTTVISHMSSDITTEPYTGSTMNDTFTSGNVTTALPAPQSTTHIFDTYNVFVHPHWKRFPLVSTGWHYFIGVFITIVCFSGIFGNSLVIFMFSRVKTLRTPSNMFLVNLAISDLTFCVVNGFPLLTLSAFNERWIFGKAACEFFGLIGGIFGLMSINTMATIALDRYFAIAKPLQVAKNMTRKRSFCMILVVWIWSFTSCMPPIFGWGRYIPEGFQTSCTFDYLTRSDNNRSYILFMYSFGFAVPLSVIFICYAMILKAINKHEKEMVKTAKKLNAEMRSNQDKQRTEIRVAKIAMGILVLYLMSWLPYATIALIAQFGDASWVTPFWSELPVMAAKASAMHNPIVYALSHPKFREALYEHMPCLVCFKPKTGRATTASSTYRERNASKRSVSSATGAVSVDSDVSQIDDNIEIKMRKLEQDKQLRADRMTRYTKERDECCHGDENSAGKIIQDLTKALTELSTRTAANSQQSIPIYLPSSVHQNTTGQSHEGASDRTPDNSVFVVDSNTLPILTEILARVTRSNNEGQTTGNVNPAFEMTQEIPDTKEVTDKGGARPKLKLNIKPDQASTELQSDEDQL